MAVKHRVKCFDSEILVCESDATAFQVNIQHTANPLGFGNTIETFDSFEKAVEAAGFFCEAYTRAREKGYYLQDKCFTKPDKEKFEVKGIIGSKQSVDTFVAQL